MAATVSYGAGIIDLSQFGGILALLGFATASYLSLVIRDRREPEDALAALGFLLYTAAFAFLSAPSWFPSGSWTIPARALGGLCAGLILAVAWTFYVREATDD